MSLPCDSHTVIRMSSLRTVEDDDSSQYSSEGVSRSLTRPSVQRSLNLVTPSRRNDYHGDSKENQYHLVSLSPADASSPLTDHEKWRMSGRGGAATSTTFMDESDGSRTDVDDIRAMERRQSSFMFPEPHALAPALQRQHFNRSLSDLYNDSPPGTPSLYDSRNGSWMPNSGNNSPHNSWMPTHSRSESPYPGYATPTPLVCSKTLFLSVGSANTQRREVQRPSGHCFLMRPPNTSIRTGSKKG